MSHVQSGASCRHYFLPLIAALFLQTPAALGAPDDAIDLPDPGQLNPNAEAYRIVRERVPTLNRFRLVRLDTSTLASRARDGKPVRLPFAGHADSRLASIQAPVRDVVIDFNPVQIVAPGDRGLLIYEFGRGEIQTQSVDRPGRFGFVGQVRGQQRTTAGYILQPDMVLGTTLIPNPPVGSSGISVIEPVKRLLSSNGATPQEVETVAASFNHVVYNSAALETYQLIDEEDTGRVDSAKHHHEKDASRARIHEDISIYMMGDTQYTGNYVDTDAAFDDQLWTLFGVELITAVGEDGPNGNDEFDINIDVTGQALWISGGPSSTDPATLLEQSYNQFPWSAISTAVNDIGLVHLFTGKNLDGNVIGKAWKIGGFDDACGTDYSVDGPCKQSVGQPQFGGNTWYTEVILMAHELGHNLDAVHGDSDANYCAGSTCGPSIMNSSISAGQVLFYSEDNAEAIADKVDAECANDDC
ncbi:MAG: M12 family metallo-peptidase [Gammaproteobacteria bacterium]